MKRLSRMSALWQTGMPALLMFAILIAQGVAQPAHAEETPAAKPHQTAGWIGANYTAAYAVNQVQFWHDFRPDVIERELAAAKKYLGITSLRVYLHNINHEEEKDTLLANIEKFLVICDRHDIKPGFVFFDDCHRRDGIYIDKPTKPVKGYHNGRWAVCPQDRYRQPENQPKLKAYIQDIVSAHRDDPRVLWWEVFNEPSMRREYSVELRKLGYAWAKEVKPTQPVICCWDDSPETEIVNAHNYGPNRASWDKQADRNPAKGCVFTEAGARWYAPRVSNGEPVELMHWLQGRKAAGKYVPGVYLCWELMVGNSNCRWYWGTPEGTPEPAVPWCGLLWPDGEPVSLAEAEAIRRYATGKSRAMLFDDFQDLAAPLEELPKGWKKYGGSGKPMAELASRGVTEPKHFSRVMDLEPSAVMLAGDAKWTDYVLEGRVMLKGDQGNAGLLFRATASGEDDAEKIAGYYIGFDTKTLVLSKIGEKSERLAEFDLSKLDCKVIPGVWNQIRVAIEGGRIRVWFDRMHPSADKDRGLRIDCTDESPIAAGAVGMRTEGVTAWFDNIVVLPISELP